MDSEKAVIEIDVETLDRALVTQLGSAVISRAQLDEELDMRAAEVDITVDGAMKEFTILHASLVRSDVDSVVLMRSVGEDGSDSNWLEFVLINIDADGPSARQCVFKSLELSAVRNMNYVLRELLGQLYR